MLFMLSFFSGLFGGGRNNESKVNRLRGANPDQVVRTHPPTSGTCDGCGDSYIITCPDCTGPDEKCKTCEGVGEIPCTMCHPSAQLSYRLAKLCTKRRE